MNLKDEIVQWPKRFKEIPKPFYVIRAGEHYMVCELNELGDLIEELSTIHCDVFTVRRLAFKIAVEASAEVSGVKE